MAGAERSYERSAPSAGGKRLHAEVFPARNSVLLAETQRRRKLR
jgi:hypothetical protein